MTAVELLAWITGALLVQVAAGAGVAIWRWRHVAAKTAPSSAQTRPQTKSDAAWAGWRDFRVARREHEDAAQSQCSFYLEPVDRLALPAFKPGQFLTFSLSIDDAAAGAARTITRCYSLSDRPDPAYYRVTIKRIGAPPDMPDVAPGLSSNHFHDRVHEGDVLRVKAPSGHFFIDPDPAVPAVLVGGGIGITPMMSMLRWCMAEQPARAVHLYHGVRSSRDHAFKRTLEELAASHPALHLNVVYSRPAAGDLKGRDFQHEGHVDVELLRRTLPHGRCRFYVCGPAAMMQTLVPALAEWGVPGSDIHFEAFGPASVRPVASKPAAASAGGALLEVRFSRSGRTLSWDGSDASLLDFAERHGIEVDSGCRSGGCGTCETKLVEGRVDYEHAPDHDVAPGHCLLCVGKPAAPLVLEA